MAIRLAASNGTVMDDPPCVIVAQGQLAPAEDEQREQAPADPAGPYAARCSWMQREAAEYRAAVRRRRRRPLIAAALALGAIVLLAARAWAGQ